MKEVGERKQRKGKRKQARKKEKKQQISFLKKMNCTKKENQTHNKKIRILDCARKMRIAHLHTEKQSESLRSCAFL